MLRIALAGLVATWLGTLARYMLAARPLAPVPVRRPVRRGR